MMMNLPLLRAAIFFVTLCVVVANRPLRAEGEAVLLFKQAQCQNLTVSDNGHQLTVVNVVRQNLDAKAKLPPVAQAGWYQLTGEYESTGFDPMGSVVFAVDGSAGSSDQPHPAVTSWSPLVINFQVNQTGAELVLHVRSDTPQAQLSGNTRIQVRNLAVRPYSIKENTDLIGNGDFSIGKLGELPALWTWSYHGNSGDYQLAEDKSFRSGTKTLRVTSENLKDARAVAGSRIPFPAKGRLTFNVWGRSDDARVNMDLFLVGSDFRWFKKISVPLTASWKMYTIEADIAERPTSPYVYPRVDISGIGTAHLAGATLTWTEKPVPSVAAVAPPVFQGGRNKLPNPDMELGFNGWALDFYAQKKPSDMIQQLRSDETRIVRGAGIDGGSAVLVSPGNCLISHCMPIELGKTYTVSAYMKAAKDGDQCSVYLIDAGWSTISSHVFKGLSSSKWERYSFSMKWEKPSFQRKAYIRFDAAAANVLVDRVQFEEGPLTDYEAPPIMLGILSEKLVYSRGQSTDGQTAEVIVRGPEFAPAKIEMTVRDAWGRELQAPRLLKLASGVRTTIPLNDLPTDRLGILIATLSAYDSAGKKLAQSESRYAVLDAPAHAMLPNGFPLFGIEYEPFSTLWIDRKALPYYTMAGAAMNRYFLPPEPLQDESYRSLLGQQLKIQADAGWKMDIANFDLTPRITELLKDQDVATPEGLNALEEHLQTIVPPLKNRIRYWEVLNETNIWNYHEGPRRGQRSMPPGKYVAILRRSYETIKKIDPSLKVVGFALSGSDFDYLRACMKLGAGKYMDVCGWHAYRSAPDMPETYADIMTMKSILKENGFNGPLVNDEQYYAANLYVLHNHDEEISRQYFVGADDEMWATGRIMQGYIQHAAAQVTWCLFGPGANFLKFGVQDYFFPFYTYGAYNAATRIFNDAGPGVPVRIGSDCRAYFFAEASGGPLLAIYTLLPDLKGAMKLPGVSLTAYDMMGNEISQEELARNGIPLQVSPVYVRLPQVTKLEQIQGMLHQAEITGLGDPFGLRATVMNDGRLGINVTNRRNQPISGKITISDYPKDWKPASDTVHFDAVTGGASLTVPFDGKFAIKVMDEYKLTASAVSDSDQAFTRQDLRLSPIFAYSVEHPKIGGPISQWTQWIDLGEDRLSADYSRERPHTGPADLAARLSLGWDHDGLSLALVVTDDVAVFPTFPRDFNSDSLQIYFDQKSNADSPKAQYDSDDITYYVGLINGKAQAIVEKGVDNRFLGESNQTTGLDSDVEVNITRQGNQTIYQIHFPARCLPLVRLESGSVLNFSILINDNDGKGRKTGLTLAPRGTEPFNKPYYYRTLILR